MFATSEFKPCDFSFKGVNVCVYYPQIEDYDPTPMDLYLWTCLQGRDYTIDLISAKHYIHTVMQDDPSVDTTKTQNYASVIKRVEKIELSDARKLSRNIELAELCDALEQQHNLQISQNTTDNNNNSNKPKNKAKKSKKKGTSYNTPTLNVIAMLDGDQPKAKKEKKNDIWVNITTFESYLPIAPTSNRYKIGHRIFNCLVVDYYSVAEDFKEELPVDGRHPEFQELGFTFQLFKCMKNEAPYLMSKLFYTRCKEMLEPFPTKTLPYSCIYPLYVLMD